jgi:hypothetical protein
MHLAMKSIYHNFQVCDPIISGESTLQFKRDAFISQFVHHKIAEGFNLILAAVDILRIVNPRQQFRNKLRNQYFFFHL